MSSRFFSADTCMCSVSCNIEPGVPEGNYGIQEIVTDALSIPPCQYGEVLWEEEDGSISYATRAVDVYLPGHRKTEAPIGPAGF